MGDRETLDYYDRAAADYAARLSGATARPELARFIARIAPGGRVLDLGCGPGTASAAMAAAGLRPDPVDASAGMVAHARARHALPARQGTFDEDHGEETYDGVWASYSLLHAPRAALPGLIGGLVRALRTGGTLYLGMKLGTGARRDRLGRLYTYVTEDEMRGWLGGVRVIEAVAGSSAGMTGETEPCLDLMAETPDA